MSHEDEFAGFKEERLAGAGPQAPRKACWVGSPGEAHSSSPVLGVLAHLCLLNSRQMLKGASPGRGVGARVSAPKDRRDLYSVQVAQASGHFLLSSLLRDFSRKETKRDLGVGSREDRTFDLPARDLLDFALESQYFLDSSVSWTVT